MPHLRTWAEVQNFSPTPSELKLITKSVDAEDCILGDGSLPREHSSQDRNIRQEILRYVLLGGCKSKPTDKRGVSLYGANIVGQLELDNETITGDVYLENCSFSQQLDSAGSQFKTVYFQKCTLHGWFAQGAFFSGNVAIENSTSTGEVNFALSTIRGALEFSGTRIRTGNLDSVLVHSAEIKGAVFFHPDATSEGTNIPEKFEASGEVNFVNTKVGGFYAEHAMFSGADSAGSVALTLRNMSCHGDLRLNRMRAKSEVVLSGARVDGSLELKGATLSNNHGHALTAKNMTVNQSFVWKEINHKSGSITITGSKINELDDDPDIEIGPNVMNLDGVTYKRIKGKVSTLPERKKWLEKVSYFEGEFRPHPYTQYAKFLRDVGHDKDAREILELREEQLRKEERKALSTPDDPPTWNYVSALIMDVLVVLHWLFADKALKYLIGYGHRPFRSLWWLAILILATIFPAHYAWENGDFAPNSAVIQSSDDWKKIDETEKKPALVWSGDLAPVSWSARDDKDKWKYQAPGQDWETFDSIAYGLDVVIPIINFGQTEAWAPSTNRGKPGSFLYWWRWVMTSAGWAVTALGAAAITGLIRKN